MIPQVPSGVTGHAASARSSARWRSPGRRPPSPRRSSRCCSRTGSTTSTPPRSGRRLGGSPAFWPAGAPIVFLPRDEDRRADGGRGARVDPPLARADGSRHDRLDPAPQPRAPGRVGAGARARAVRSTQRSRRATKGSARFIGVTRSRAHGRAPAPPALERFPFDSVLCPCNPVILADEVYGADFRALVRVCADRGVALQTIKAVTKGPWGSVEPTAEVWYEPLTAQQDIDVAVSFALGHDGVFLNTVGGPPPARRARRGRALRGGASRRRRRRACRAGQDDPALRLLSGGDGRVARGDRAPATTRSPCASTPVSAGGSPRSRRRPASSTWPAARRP